MPNTREKMMELLMNVPGYLIGCESLADYLIANGVTIPVRCKECKHYDEQEMRCDHPSQYAEYCYDCYLSTKPGDFCSRGERREGE